MPLHLPGLHPCVAHAAAIANVPLPDLEDVKALPGGLHAVLHEIAVKVFQDRSVFEAYARRWEVPNIDVNPFATLEIWLKAMADECPYVLLVSSL